MPDPAVLAGSARALAAAGVRVGGVARRAQQVGERVAGEWAFGPLETALAAAPGAPSLLAPTWTGAGAQAFRQRAARLRLGLEDTATLLHEAAAVFDRYATAMRDALTIEASARRLAAREDLTITPTGAIRPASDAAPEDGAAGRVASLLGESAALAEQAHLQAAMALERLARQALRLAIGEDIDVARATQTGWLSVVAIPGVPAPPIPTGLDAAGVARWWENLSPEQRMALLAERPAIVGSLAGIPVAWRDWANRLTLQRALLGPTGQPPDLATTRARAATSPGWNLWYRLATITDDPRFKLHRQDVYLLQVGLHAPGGRAVIALGDPTQADHVGVVVPGTNNNLGNVQNPIRDAARLRVAVDDLPDPTTFDEIATVMWLGYETPTDVAGMDPRGYGSVVDAADPGEAEAGAPTLAAFIDELREIHDPASRPHVSVFGHSYGSTVTGMAAVQGMPADDVVLFGSPGAGAATADQLQVPDGHVWATRIHDDPIRWGEGPASLGEDPVDEEFDARRFSVDPPPVQSGHSDYYKFKTQGLRNFAWIMIGEYDKVH